MKYCVVVVWCLLSALGSIAELPVVHTPYGTFHLGKRPYPPGAREEAIARQQALAKPPIDVLADAPPPRGYANHSHNLPPIGNQGAEGSCVHFAGTYMVKTYYMRQREALLPSGAIASPRFTYNLSNSGLDAGGYGHEPFEIFMRYGCPTLAQLPYVAGNYQFLPPIDAFREGLHRRTESYVWLYDWQPTPAQITQLKQILDAGHIGVVGVNASDPGFSNWGSTGNYTPFVGAPCTFNDIDHMVTLCGYGDGWYLIANSWGTSFGSNGFIYVDSAYFEQYVSDFMYPIEGSYAPLTHWLECDIRHTWRSDITDIDILLNDTRVWHASPHSPRMPHGSVASSDARDNVQVAIDLSSASWPMNATELTFRCIDTVSADVGTIHTLQVVTPYGTFTSTDTPVAIPDNNGTYASATVVIIPEPTSITVLGCVLYMIFRRRQCG